MAHNWALIDGAATLNGTDLRPMPIDRVLNVTHTWARDRLERGAAASDEGRQHLEEFDRLMEGSQIPTGPADLSQAQPWEITPAALSATASLMGMSAMAPPVDGPQAPEPPVGD